MRYKGYHRTRFSRAKRSHSEGRDTWEIIWKKGSIINSTPPTIINSVLSYNSSNPYYIYRHIELLGNSSSSLFFTILTTRARDFHDKLPLLEPSQFTEGITLRTPPRVVIL